MYYRMWKRMWTKFKLSNNGRQLISLLILNLKISKCLYQFEQIMWMWMINTGILNNKTFYIFISVLSTVYFYQIIYTLLRTNNFRSMIIQCTCITNNIYTIRCLYKFPPRLNSPYSLLRPNGNTCSKIFVNKLFNFGWQIWVNRQFHVPSP